MTELDERSRALAYRLINAPSVMFAIIDDACVSETALDELRSAAALLFVFARSLEAALTEAAPGPARGALPDDEHDEYRWTLPPHAPASVA